jgi:hypothetical protein
LSAAQARSLPPRVWRDSSRGLVGPDAGDYRELFELASDETLTRERELEVRERKLEAMQAERRELKERLDEAIVTEADLLGALDDMRRRVSYYQSKLAVRGDADAYTASEIEPFRPLLVPRSSTRHVPGAN